MSLLSNSALGSDRAARRQSSSSAPTYTAGRGGWSGSPPSLRATLPALASKHLPDEPERLHPPGVDHELQEPAVQVRVARCHQAERVAREVLYGHLPGAPLPHQPVFAIADD